MLGGSYPEVKIGKGGIFRGGDLIVKKTH